MEPCHARCLFPSRLLLGLLLDCAVSLTHHSSPSLCLLLPLFCSFSSCARLLQHDPSHIPAASPVPINRSALWSPSRSVTCHPFHNCRLAALTHLFLPSITCRCPTCDEFEILVWPADVAHGGGWRLGCQVPTALMNLRTIFHPYLIVLCSLFHLSGYHLSRPLPDYLLITTCLSPHRPRCILGCWDTPHTLVDL